MRNLDIHISKDGLANYGFKVWVDSSRVIDSGQARTEWGARVAAVRQAKAFLDEEGENGMIYVKLLPRHDRDVTTVVAKKLHRSTGVRKPIARVEGAAAYTEGMSGPDLPGKTTIELDALDDTRLIEVPVEKPDLEPIDHDAHGGWPQYEEGPEFDHTAEEVADQDLVEADRAERGLDR